MGADGMKVLVLLTEQIAICFPQDCCTCPHDSEDTYNGQALGLAHFWKAVGTRLLHLAGSLIHHPWSLTN